MADYNLFITYPLGASEPQENFARTKNLFQQLKSIHPVLSSFSPTGKGKSYAGMLNETCAEDMSFEQWEKYYRRVVKHIDYLPGHNYHGIKISYWNRIKPQSEWAVLDIVYDAFSDRYTNYLMLSTKSYALYELEIVDSIMSAGIDCFGAYRAESCWYDPDRQFKFSHHTLWMAEGLPFPTGKDLGRYQPNHPPPPISEPWHGGTRYTWPEHDPRILMQQYP